jgi:hypothetical protein
MQRTGQSVTTSDRIRSVFEHMLTVILVHIINVHDINVRRLCHPKPLKWLSARLCRRDHPIDGTDPVALFIIMSPRRPRKFSNCASYAATRGTKPRWEVG